MNDPRSTSPKQPAFGDAPHGEPRVDGAPDDDPFADLARIVADSLPPAGQRKEPAAPPPRPGPAGRDFGFDADDFERALNDTPAPPVPPPAVRPRTTPSAPPLRPVAQRPGSTPASAPAAAPRSPAPPRNEPPALSGGGFDMDDIEAALASELNGNVPPRAPVPPAPRFDAPPGARPPEGPKAAMAPVSRGPAARVLNPQTDEDGEETVPFEPLPPIEKTVSRRAGPVRPTVIHTPPVPQIEEPPAPAPDPMQHDFPQDYGLSPFDLANAARGATRPNPARSEFVDERAEDDPDDDSTYVAAFDDAISGWQDDGRRNEGRPGERWDDHDDGVADHNFVDPHDDQAFAAVPPPPAAPRRRRSGALWIAATIGIVVLLGIVGYSVTEYFGGGLSDENAPVIKADESPVKVEPPASTAAETSDPSKVFYDRVAETNKPENQTLDTPSATAEGVTTNGTPGASELPGVGGGQAAQGGAAAEPGATPVIPRKVRTVVVRPDGTIVTPDPSQAAADFPPPSAAPSAPAAAALTPAQEGAAEDPLAAKNYITPGNFVMPKPRPDNTQGALETPAPAVQTADAGVPPDVLPNGFEARTAAAAPVTPALPPIQAATAPVDLANAAGAGPPGQETASAEAGADTNGDVPSAASGAPETPFGVQVASQKSRADAEKAFAALKRKFPALLGNVTPTIVSADLGAKGVYYRVRVPARSSSEANALCTSLKSAGGSCFVVRS